DHVERRRLARAVRAEQADDLALGHVERQPSDDFAGFVALFEAGGRQCSHHGVAAGAGFESSFFAPFDAFGSMVMITRSLLLLPLLLLPSSVPVLRISARRMS